MFRAIWKTEAGRLAAVILLGLLAMWALGTAEGWGALVFSGLTILAVVAFSHIVRRLLFPYLDLKTFAARARNEPIATSLVFASVCLVLAAVIIAQSVMLL